MADPRPARPVRPVRYTGFVVTGLVVGLVAALLLWLLGSGDARYADLAALGYFAALFGLVGAILGGGVGVLVEATMARRAGRNRGRATGGR